MMLTSNGATLPKQGAADLLAFEPVFGTAICQARADRSAPGPSGSIAPDKPWAFLIRFLDAASLIASALIVAAPSGRHAALRQAAVALILAVLCIALVALAFDHTRPDLIESLGTWLGLTVALFATSRLVLAGLQRWPSTRTLIQPRFAVFGHGPMVHKTVCRLGDVLPGELAGVFSDAGSLVALAKRGEVEQIFLVSADTENPAIDALARTLARLAVDVTLCRADQDAETLVTRQIAFRPLRGHQILVKEMFDRLLALILLVVVAPLLLGIAAAVKLTSKGPVLFSQKRHGLRNTEILVYKFRSMRVETSDFSGRNQTRRDDPRVTRLGAFLRASSLDELPQLLNVVRGDMSLVGPRPHPVDMRTAGLLCSEIVEDYDSRHRIKPGITGWAQINGSRGATTTREQVERRVMLDNHYIENWSVLLDLRIMLLTGLRLFKDANAF